MDKKNNIFWGIVLVVIGFLFLGTNLNWFNLDWSFQQIARFWPLMLIAAGVAALLHQKKSIYNATSALLIAFAIPLGIYTCVDDKVGDFKDEINEGFNIDIDDFDEDDNDSSSKNDTVSSDRNKQYFAVEMTPEVKEATLNLKGGAAEFDLEESSNRLFEATTLLQYKGNYALEEEKTANAKIIDFSMKDGKGKNNDFNFDGNNNNDVVLKLSTAPIWTIDMGIGAGEVDFDLSNYKVKKLNLETGAASIDIKFGDKQENVAVDVKSGVASVKIHVPESVGCEIRMDGALNSKDFDDFEKIRDGVWQTKGYDKSAKKITLNVESGLSSLKVSRY